jgi:hypothetical protein
MNPKFELKKRSCGQFKKLLAVGIGLATMLLAGTCPPLLAQGTLAVANISELLGPNPGVYDSVRVTFGLMDQRQVAIFDTLLFTTNDVGRLFVITEADDQDFESLVSALTNGNPDWVGDEVDLGPGGGGSWKQERQFFWPLPGGGNDFRGFHIDNIALQIVKLTLTHPTEESTALSFAGKIFVNSKPVLPTISMPPKDQTAEAGGVANFVVRADGAPVITYQWFFNGNAITSCTTNCCLCLSDVQKTNIGAYTVVVSNYYGAKTSAPVALNVIAAVERRAMPSLDLLGETGSTLNVEYADALDATANWLPLGTMISAGTPHLYLDVSAPLPPQRFYRVWQTGTPGTPPSLDLPYFVPAITLMGNIGDKLRVDCINQFGPTDAWVNLATVTLTNTSQLYFDISAPQQPARLYRIVLVP